MNISKTILTKDVIKAQVMF